MTAIHVDRYMFSVDEVVAAVLPNVGRAREIEMRIDADGYVVVDIVAPVEKAAEQPADEQPPADEAREKPRPPPAEPDKPETSTSSGPGQREIEARRLCGTPLFRAFLEVKTEEAALKVLADRCHVQQLADLDRSRSNGMNLRHVTEEFEAWKIS